MAAPSAPVQPSSATLNRLQRQLGRKGYYSGPLTKFLTEKQIKGLQQYLIDLGYTNVTVNGTLDANTQKYIQTAAKNRGGGYTGAINSTVDLASWDGLLKVLQRTPQNTPQN